MTVLKGFYGKLLRINLTEQNYQVENIPEEVFKQYLGGKGLGTYLLLKYLSPGIHPLSPENILIFTTGFTTGTNVFGSSRYGVFTKSPATGLYSESYSGGHVAPAIHATGYDAIMLEGAAKEPVYLEISDEKVAFHNADHLWGQDTYQTEDIIKKEIGKSKCQALVIGPAGENLVRFACIENNYWRSAGRTGVGAVIGSKKVKGMAFYGNARVQIADPDLLKELNKETAEIGKDHPGVLAYRTYGTTQMVRALNKSKAFPARYWSQGSVDYWEDISGDALLENFDVKNTACARCFISCGKTSTVRKGKYQGLTIEGPEFETIYSFGGLCCIKNLDEIAYLNDICDRLGMDTISAGNLVGLVMEATEQGRNIPIKLTYGDGEGAGQLLEDIAYGRGVGTVLAKGIKKVAEEWDLEDLAVHCKGLEPGGYDPRTLKGMSLQYAASVRGAVHVNAWLYKPELGGQIDRKSVEGKAQLFVEMENRYAIFHAGTLCIFFRDLYDWPQFEKMVKAITGWDYDKEELARIGHRIISATRLFNAREGATIKDDVLPKRIHQLAINDGEDAVTPDEVKFMIDEYYRIRGWDEKGFPIEA
jgi:aldehyde:ferredoxin oxidoreductase